MSETLIVCHEAEETMQTLPKTCLSRQMHFEHQLML